MSLKITNNEKINLLHKQKINIESIYLIKYLNNIKNNTLNYLKNLLNYNININTDICLNPPLWQFGHIIDFYIKNTLNLLEIKNNLTFNILKTYIKQSEITHNIKFHLYFDSFYTSRDYRFTFNLCFERLKLIYISIIKILISFIKCNIIDSIDTYLIMLSILHNDMHNENFIFSYYFLCNMNLSTNICKNYITLNHIQINNTFINIKSGSYYQGATINTKNLIFDNETPPFLVNIKSFNVSKYTITEYEYLEFIINNGYYIDKYWSYNGLLWKNKNNISSPLYWFSINNVWFRKHYNQIYKIGSNLPVCNICYYEAEAYCNWINCRLITESEYEYLATNSGSTLYPWGNSPPTIDLCNINNIHNYCINVDLYENGANNDSVNQLIGNVWEWCYEEIYPYNNFTIDYVYREMSYPYFGKKKICRGGCFCVNDFLINSKYRNAQLPDCRTQFIGFRICSDSI